MKYQKGKLGKTPIYYSNKKKKVPRNIFNERCKDLYLENYRTLKTEIKEDTNKWKHIPSSWIGRITIIKMSIPPKAIYRFNATSITIMIYFHLFILSFISLALEDVLVKILLHAISEILLPMFSSRIFMVLQLMFKSFIHFEFILVYGVSWWSSLIFSASTSPVFPTPFIDAAIFTELYACAPFAKYYLTIETWVYHWPLCSVPLIYVSVVMPVPDCFDYCGLVI